MRRVLITSATSWLGSNVARALVSDEVYGVDTVPPTEPTDAAVDHIPDGGLGVAHRFLEIDPHVLIHLDGDRGAETPTTAQALFGAVRRSTTIQQVVVQSSTGVYGTSPRLPSIVTEATAATARGSCEREARSSAEDLPDVSHTILRLAHIVGPTIGNAVSRYLRLPAVPTRFGFDPRLQFLHETDAVAAFTAAAQDGAADGVFNIAAPGQMYLSRVLRLGRRLGQPMPKALYERTMRALAQGGLSLSSALQDELKTGLVADTTAMRIDLGFRPRHDVRQTVLDLYRRTGREAA